MLDDYVLVEFETRGNELIPVYAPYCPIPKAEQDDAGFDLEAFTDF